MFHRAVYFSRENFFFVFFFTVEQTTYKCFFFLFFFSCGPTLPFLAPVYQHLYLWNCPGSQEDCSLSVFRCDSAKRSCPFSGPPQDQHLLLFLCLGREQLLHAEERTQALNSDNVLLFGAASVLWFVYLHHKSKRGHTLNI